VNQGLRSGSSKSEVDFDGAKNKDMKATALAHDAFKAMAAGACA